ncbi:hypothetical protein [Allorhodopirellula solitaria]|uniref:hypothetical protein n=1 Tax=Allorhodopirellula solitaria TaxID=2527987 RepID=UPI0011B67974|nr:hypothetical protein [Allorhodopirellula solitaria]
MYRRIAICAVGFLAVSFSVLAFTKRPTWVRPEVRGNVTLSSSTNPINETVVVQCTDSDGVTWNLDVDRRGKFFLPAKKEMRTSYWGDTCLVCNIKCWAENYKEVDVQVAICDGELVGSLPVPVRILEIELQPTSVGFDSEALIQRDVGHRHVGVDKLQTTTPERSDGD